MANCRYTIDGKTHSAIEFEEYLRRMEPQEAAKYMPGVKSLPSMPMSGTWPALAMKRMIKYAADHGYDRVAWTPGQVQADRFKLSRQISSVQYHDASSGGIGSPDMNAPNGRGILAAYDHSGRRVLDKNIENPEQELPDLIGKEAAERLLNAEKQDVPGVGGWRTRKRELSGLDLNVGGEGMKGFYDKILPAETNKIVNKFGAKVERGEVPRPYDSRDEVVPDAQAQAEHGPEWRRILDQLEPLHDANSRRTLDDAGERRMFELQDQLNALHSRMIDDTLDRGGSNTQDVHQVTLTPSMRDAVAEHGLSLFAPEAPFTEEERTKAQTAAAPVRAAATGVMSAVKDVFASIQKGLAPISIGTQRAQAFAAEFAATLRRVMYRFGQIDRNLERNYKPDERNQMGTALDNQSVFEQQVRDLPPEEQAARRAEFDRGRTGLAGLSPKARAVIDVLNNLSQQVWQRLVDRGLVAPNARPIPYYFPRQIVRFTEGAGFSRPGGEGGNRGLDPRGGNLTTNASPMSREHMTPEETEAAAQAALGPDVSLLRDIRSLPQRLAFVERAIAGVDLMNSIEQVGRQTGVNLTVRGDIPGLLSPGDYFTMNDHPAFRRWTGSGWQSINVAKEFEGPLRAVLTQASPAWYNAAMKLKGGVMSSIMFSPFIHLAVELGRALPVMPGRILTLRALRDGSRLRQDPEYMDRAIRDGIAPLGQGWHADPVSIADQANVDGRNRFVRALQNFRDTVGRGAQAVGGEWLRDVLTHPHQALLWDQVFNLQMGIYDAIRNKQIARGVDGRVAGIEAAQVANRYAGALPTEHLSKAANMAANMLLFSRSFTLGNLGVIKDMFTGAPKHVLARIEQMAGPEAAAQAKTMLQRKAISAFALDIGLFYMANGLMQAGIQAYRQAQKDGTDYPTAAGKVFSQWVDQSGQAMHEAKDNPLSIFGVLPQHWNEPGKQDRVYAGTDSAGRGIYLRLPPGKVGEEFLGWFTRPGTLIVNKLNPMVRPIVEAIMGHDSLGRQLFKPDPQTVGDYLGIAGAVAKHIGEAVVPLQTIQGLGDMYSHYVQGKPTVGDPAVAAAKVLGPMTGAFQVSSGFPGGPAAGVVFGSKQREKFEVQQAMPEIRQKVVGGDIEGATKQMQELGMSPGEIRNYVRLTLNPGVSRSAEKGFGLYGSEHERAQRGYLQQ